MTALGIDCTSTITQTIAKSLKDQGYLYVGRYLGNTSWKCMKKAEADTIKAAGLNIISFWETAPTKTSYFTAAKGKSDALSAIAFAKSVGQPAGSVIYFTVDFDAEASSFDEITSYFNAVKANIGSDYLVGAYGNYAVIKYLHDNKIVNYFTQTYAWSSKQKNDFVNIYQYKIDVKNAPAGIMVDYLEIDKEDCGAWGAAAPAPVPTPAIDPVAPTPSVTPTVVPSPPKPAPIVVPDTYTVQAGDTLSEICGKFGLDLATIEAYNHITNPNLIQVGQVLCLKKKAPTPKPSVTTYKIKAGDTLSDIAKKFGTTVAALEKLNGISDPNKIYTGEVIKVPGQVAPVAPVKPSAPTTYTVKSGDTLSDIAGKFNTTVVALKKLNRLPDEDKIFPGQVLKLK